MEYFFQDVERAVRADAQDKMELRVNGFSFFFFHLIIVTKISGVPETCSVKI